MICWTLALRMSGGTTRKLGIVRWAEGDVGSGLVWEGERETSWAWAWDLAWVIRAVERDFACWCS